jgi:preprotein translocase subunit SecG
MLSVLLHILYVPVCVFLILVVLLQSGKRADLAGAFGGGGSQTAFGARGAATLLAKVTTASAVMFMIVALALSIVGSREAGSGGTVLDEVPAETSTPAPVEQPPLGLLEESAPLDETTAEDPDLSLTEEPTTTTDAETDAEPAVDEDQP